MDLNEMLTDPAILAVYAKERLSTDDELTVTARALRACGKIAYGDADPANQCMNYFLDPTALGPRRRWEFDLPTLFAEDKSVRGRVYSEIVRRTLGALTIREQVDSLSSSQPSRLGAGWGVLSGTLPPRPAAFGGVPGGGVLKPAESAKRAEAYIDPIITIFQQNFSHAGWWGALGTFPLTWERSVDIDQNGRFAVVISGEDRYDWHPDDNKRSSQRLHRWATDLIRAGRAAPFTMVAKPLTLVVDTKNLRVMDKNAEGPSFLATGFQYNPAVGKAGRVTRTERYFGD